jgi:hypothetical protein
MTEDPTPEVLAYLLDEMDRPRRAAFEVQLARDPAIVALVKSVADSLTTDALEQTAAMPLSAAEVSQASIGVLAAVERSHGQRRASLGRYLWPLAAAVLLALNVGQWIVHSRPPALTVDLVDNSEAAPLKNPGAVPTGLHVGGNPPAPPQPAGTATLSITQTLTITHTYAWSAFDRTSHLGVLDLHNLPAVAADKALQLWVLPAGARRFEPVGEIPSQFYGHSGSITYKLAPTLATPAQIMITVERRSVTPISPSGTVVLHGP